MKSHLAAATTFAFLLDNQFGIGKFRFGLNALLDLIPYLGDSLDAVLSLYIVWIAIKMRVPATILVRMISNIAINFLIGLIPVVGDVVYLVRKVNTRNLYLLKQYTSL